MRVIGIIQKTLVECLLEAGGDDLRQRVFARAGVPADRVFRMDQDYPDTELARLLQATVQETGLDEDTVFDLFSATFLTLVDEVFPAFVQMAKTSEDLVRMQVKIHALIAAGMRAQHTRDKVTDKFVLEDGGAHHVTVRYKSDLQLCGLYRALVRATADRYGDTVEIETVRCRKRGADACGFCVRWTALNGVPTPLAQADMRQAPQARRA